jgi:hypothetical protein
MDNFNYCSFYFRPSPLFLSFLFSVADADPLLDDTVLTLDEAAPVKLAITLVHPSLAQQIVAPATAHGPTAIAARAGPIAAPSNSTWK